MAGTRSSTRKKNTPKKSKPVANQPPEDLAGYAERYWGNNEEPVWDAKVVEELYDRELSSAGFPRQKIAALEFSQYLEKYLWPFFDPAAATRQHVLSILLMVNQKARDKADPWACFDDGRDRFSGLMRSTTDLLLGFFSNDQSLSAREGTIAIQFIAHAFQGLENALVRGECMRLVSIGTWNCLESDAQREAEFAKFGQLKKLWKHMAKKAKAAEDEQKQRMDNEQRFLSELMKHSARLIYKLEMDEDEALYLQRVVELLTDLESQLPTRRYIHAVVTDHQIVELYYDSPFVRRGDGSSQEFCKLLDLLDFYYHYEIDEYTGAAYTEKECVDRCYKRLADLQRIAFRDFKDSLTDLALTNIGGIKKGADLQPHLANLSEDELVQLCKILAVRTTPLVGMGEDVAMEGQQTYSSEFLIRVLVSRLEERPSQMDRINAMPVYPDENMLFDDALVRTDKYSGDAPLPLPKLNLQFLSIHDYLLRSFNLYRLESAYDIRQDVEEAIKRLHPRMAMPDEKTVFNGWARMASPIESFAVLEVGKPRVGEDRPSEVTANITINVDQCSPPIKKEWETIRKHDVLLLISVKATKYADAPYDENAPFREHFGIQSIRGCEVASTMVGDGQEDQENKPAWWRVPTSLRTYRVLLDCNQFGVDMDRQGRTRGEDVYQTFNVVMRRRSKENNFKAILESIRDLMQSETAIPDWLHNVFLGYGDPSSAHYSKYPKSALDFRDTFLDLDHLKESFPGKTIHVDASLDSVSGPPFVVDFSSEDEGLIVKSYKPPNNGPYPMDQPKQNSIRFTPAQVEAIRAGSSPGLALIVGPPGTGKTDVAVQIISNIYHNCPTQRTLLITHSNQALNQLFEKIVALDVDERHLLRLGHGEGELETEGNFSRAGRVNAFLEKRIHLLAEVDRLAKSMGASGHHGSTCETAGYFYTAHLKPAWDAYWQAIIPSDESGLPSHVTTPAEAIQLVIATFPFYPFFHNAPQPLFPADVSYAGSVEIARGCFYHLRRIFDELEEIRAFELLRTTNDRANYLLTKEARVVAMTCTHAALKRRDLVSLNFKYDNVVMEEAAQVLEIETFIPLLLQQQSRLSDSQKSSPLQRVVLIGDHHQLPPVVKNTGFQKYANMEQSMFSRFVRLGVPTVDLDAQGRARQSIADLYRWRYRDLQDLPFIHEHAEYQSANTGFAHEYQLVDVGDFEGKGETEPTQYYYQNVGEAEYLVAVYQYMRLIGYPAEKITILTTYNGQKDLIKDVLNQRCGWTTFFGAPKVATVDKYQGRQNDYILLSLVRTKSVGHIRDMRRLTVAMSRARLGLYIFCRKALFEGCVELRRVMSLLNERPDKLHLNTTENYPTERKVTAHETTLVIDDVKHMGQFVYDTIQEKLKPDQEAEVDVDMGDEAPNSDMDQDTAAD